MFDYVVVDSSERLYIPCVGHVATMLGRWFAGSLYRRLPNGRGKFCAGLCSLGGRVVGVTVKYRGGCQKVKLTLLPGVGLRQFEVTFRYAVKCDFTGNGVVSVVVYGIGNG